MAPQTTISADLVQLLRVPWWRYGIPSPIWIEYRGTVEKFVRSNKLAPIPADQLFPAGLDSAMNVQEAGGQTARSLQPRPFPGGLRFAHLHLGREIFKLDRAQWKDFSSHVIGGFQEKLASAGTVTFDQLLELSDAVSTLT